MSSETLASACIVNFWILVLSINLKIVSITVRRQPNRRTLWTVWLGIALAHQWRVLLAPHSCTCRDLWSKIRRGELRIHPLLCRFPEHCCWIFSIVVNGASAGRIQSNLYYYVRVYFGIGEPAYPHGLESDRSCCVTQIVSRSVEQWYPVWLVSQFETFTRNSSLELPEIEVRTPQKRKTHHTQIPHFLAGHLMNNRVTTRRRTPNSLFEYLWTI